VSPHAQGDRKTGVMPPGLAGSFFRPLAMAYVLATFASLVVALTVTSAMSLLLPGRSDRRREAPLVTLLKKPYRGALPALISRPSWALAGLGGLLAAALLTVPLLGEEFLPKFQEYDFLMHWVEKPGTSLEAMDRITICASKELRAIEGVRNFGSHIGRAEVADEVVGPNFTELWISLDRDVDYPRKVAEIQEVVDGYPGLYRDLLTYLRERIKEVLTGASASIVVRVYGSAKTPRGGSTSPATSATATWAPSPGTSKAACGNSSSTAATTRSSWANTRPSSNRGGGWRAWRPS
jgi:Cu/Ag efflux pump CusA